MSGSAITTFGFPFSFFSLASMSPMVLETDSRPGNTRYGIPFASTPAICDLCKFLAVKSYLYIRPPLLRIRRCSPSAAGR